MAYLRVLHVFSRAQGTAAGSESPPYPLHKKPSLPSSNLFSRNRRRREILAGLGIFLFFCA
jgi:hypothetical protein